MSAKDVFEKRSKKILKQNSADTVGNQVEKRSKTVAGMFHKLILVILPTSLSLVQQKNIMLMLLKESTKLILMMVLCTRKQVG